MNSLILLFLSIWIGLFPLYIIDSDMEDKKTGYYIILYGAIIAICTALLLLIADIK